MSAAALTFGGTPWTDVAFKLLDQLSIPTGSQTDTNRYAIQELRRRGYVFNASEARWERPQQDAE